MISFDAVVAEYQGKYMSAEDRRGYTPVESTPQELAIRKILSTGDMTRDAFPVDVNLAINTLLPLLEYSFLGYEMLCELDRWTNLQMDEILLHMRGGEMDAYANECGPNLTILLTKVNEMIIENQNNRI